MNSRWYTNDFILGLYYQQCGSHKNLVIAKVTFFVIKPVTRDVKLPRSWYWAEQGEGGRQQHPATLVMSTLTQRQQPHSHNVSTNIEYAVNAVKCSFDSCTTSLNHEMADA